MSNKVAFSFVALDRFSRVAEKMRKKSNALKRALGSLGDKAKAIGRKFKAMEGGIRRAAKGTLVFAAGVAALGVSFLSAAANLEQLRIKMITLTGSTEVGTKLFEQLKKFAATTPFQIEGIANSANLLLGFGVEAKKVIPILGQLGDLAAGTGKNMSEFAGILGKIKGAGKLTGETYLQLAEKGVVLNKVLSKQLGISLEEIPNLISKGEISYKRVLDSIGALTAKGGLFFEATIAQSKTLSGRFSTLKDNTLFLRAEIGELIANALGLNSRMESLTGRFSKATDAVKKFRTENAGLSKAIVFAIVGFTALAVAVTGLAAASFILAAAWSPITLGILAVVVVIGGLVALFNIAIRKWDEMSEGAKAFARSANPLIAIIRGVISGYNQLKGLGLFGGNEIEIKTAQATLDKNLNVNASSRTDVNVNVSAAKGAVAAVQTRREGSVPGVNIGVNNEKSLVG